MVSVNKKKHNHPNHESIYLAKKIGHEVVEKCLNTNSDFIEVFEETVHK
jgi:hypothetical protein